MHCATVHFKQQELSQLNTAIPKEWREKPPNMLWCYTADVLQHKDILHTLRNAMPQTPMIGSTSCRGIMTDSGFSATGVALLGLWDSDGAFGVGVQSQSEGSNPILVAKKALLQAIDEAQRPGESPSLIWMHSCPGNEELLIEGIELVVGKNIPIMGGSSADHNMQGEWRQYANFEIWHDAIVIAVLYSSEEISFAFHSGYQPTGNMGIVTRAEDRILYEIDNKPAAEVYDSWSQVLYGNYSPQNDLVRPPVTLSPLGIEIGCSADIPYYRLLYPVAVGEHGSLHLLSIVNVGEQIQHMQSTRAILAERAADIARFVLDRQQWDSTQISGALMVYCAGCMLAVEDNMPQMVQEVQQQWPNIPFAGLFSYGEQGCMFGGENTHGNLMIAAMVFYKSDKQ
ncbi:MAG: FIST N-terminal domain-containing protein [Mariprofundales bacterium]